MVELIHKKFIESKLKDVIRDKGAIYVGKNLNDYISLNDAENYWKSMKPNDKKSKESKDAELGRLVQEIVIYLLEHLFKSQKISFLILGKEDINNNSKIKDITSKLGIKRKDVDTPKIFDSDIVIIDKDNLQKIDKVFILSCKGTTRERIGQFFSHLFLMDQNVMKIKYGDLYEVMFVKDKIKVKYALVTMDWAKNRDFDKFTKKGKLRKTLKEIEGFLIDDDKVFGGGLYVLNNYVHVKSAKSFDELITTIINFFK